ncbi:hypothetical protein E2K98_04275 [Bacillus salipaludis]|uniref:Uncharacterized protein n=1 Tax=Bacillus salipaludis TaxID=2547811 RepID=A0A4R5VXK6_9BACI|nr:CBO0543 family protein [Bacillus salipaludis]TDK64090.1 hypothetical protein E2K98_04275 [Bacillus salipaludis]
MKKTFEKSVLWALLIFGIISFINLIRKPPAKDWLLIFLFKGFLSSILDNLIVKKGYIKYPVKLLKTFDFSFIFDYLLYPITCVYYNQVTKKSNIFGVFLKVFYFSIPMTVTEHFLEKYTSLIKFKKGWNSFTSFYSLSITFLISRAFIAIVRKANNNPVPKN